MTARVAKEGSTVPTDRSIFPYKANKERVIASVGIHGEDWLAMSLLRVMSRERAKSESCHSKLQLCRRVSTAGPYPHLVFLSITGIHLQLRIRSPFHKDLLAA